MKLYSYREGLVAQRRDDWRQLPGVSIDDLFTAADPAAYVGRKWRAGHAISPPTGKLSAPVGQQEVWAAGVTYLRSRKARKQESEDAGGGTFYDKVYRAKRPELFFKAAGWRVVPSGGTVRIRPDSKWNVPEPELTLAINARGKIFGYTLGNDMSSRSIEGENPLYLPQAKVYDGSASLGPCLAISDEPLPPATEIRIQIERKGRVVFDGKTQLSQIKRRLADLAGWLYRDLGFPHGVYLMTGTGIVPPAEFTLARSDRITISSPPIGELVNIVA